MNVVAPSPARRKLCGSIPALLLKEMTLGVAVAAVGGDTAMVTVNGISGSTSGVRVMSCVRTDMSTSGMAVIPRVPGRMGKLGGESGRKPEYGMLKENAMSTVPLSAL